MGRKICIFFHISDLVKDETPQGRFTQNKLEAS
jgi:hypothetical protein